MKPDLKRGDRGPDVAELQDLMNRHGLLLESFLNAAAASSS